MSPRSGVVAPLWLRAKSAYGGCAFYLFIRQPMGRKSALRREIPWIPVPSIYSSARTELAKLLIYGLFRKIRVLAQDGVQIILVNRYGEAGWGAVRETLRKNPPVWSLAHRGRAVEMIAPPPPTLGGLLKLAQEQARRAAQGDSDS